MVGGSNTSWEVANITQLSWLTFKELCLPFCNNSMGISFKFAEMLTLLLLPGVRVNPEPGITWLSRYFGSRMWGKNFCQFCSRGPSLVWYNQDIQGRGWATLTNGFPFRGPGSLTGPFLYKVPFFPSRDFHPSHYLLGPILPRSVYFTENLYFCTNSKTFYWLISVCQRCPFIKQF